MSTINETYINALLADAAYVRLHATDDNSSALLTGSDLTAALSARLTQSQADFLTTNFKVKNQELSSTGGFDAVVWEGKEGTPYAGQVYVSTRGTQGATDIADDVTLAVKGLPYDQIASMVNWWLKNTASASDTQVKQIRVLQLGTTQTFVLDTPTTGTGLLAGLGAVTAVNGHSLGGYLATAFTRLFGTSAGVGSVNTFNSAGFSNVVAINVENEFSNIASLLGGAMGKTFSDVGKQQTNYYGANGANVTTNSWADFNFLMPGFNQYGQRVALYQEDLLNGNPIANHSIYKQTDLLALGSALEKLDSTMTFSKLNDIIKAGSGDMVGSYEGVLDGLRRALLGNSVVATPTSDDMTVTNRSQYHANLATLTASDTFKALIGKATLGLASSELGTTAKTDYAAFLCLDALSPVVLSTTDTTTLAALQALDMQRYLAWQADKNARLYGDTSKAFDYSDNWYGDRAAMLGYVVQANAQDTTVLSVPGAQGMHYEDLGSGTQIDIGLPNDTVIKRQTLFGDAQDNTLTGKKLADHLYGMAGNDILDGQGGGDYLEGGSGNDTLVGGSGGDTMLGGSDFDTYRIIAGEGFDTIQDKDGVVKFTLNGEELSLDGGAAVPNAQNTWVGQGGKVYYSLIPASSGVGHDLIVSTTQGAFKVAGFQSGDLGITLQGAAADTTVRTADAIDRSGNTDILNSSATSGWTELEYRGDHDKVTVEGNYDAVVLPAYSNSPVDNAGDVLIGAGGDDLLATGLENPYVVYSDYPDIHNITSTTYNPLGLDVDGVHYQYLYSLTDGAQDVGEDHIEGNAGSDVLAGGNKRDELLGGADGDWLFGGRGADFLDGGAGDDLLFASHSLERRKISEFSALLPGESVLATSSNGGVNYWRATARPDGFGELIYRLDGLDVVDTQNQIDGHLTYGPLSDYVDVDAPQYGWGGDLLFGGTGNDVLIGSHATDYLYGEDDNDRLIGRGGADRLYGGSGGDSIYGDGYSSSSIDWGGAPSSLDGDDYLDGGSGDDFLYGGGGNDYLIGGSGIDYLFGGEGADTLEVGLGDRAFGEQGADVYSVSGDSRISDADGRNSYRIDAAKVSSLLLDDTSKAGGTIEVVNASSAGVSPVLTFFSDGSQRLTIGDLKIDGLGWDDGSLVSVSVDNTIYTADYLLANSPSSRNVAVTGSGVSVVTGAGADYIQVQGAGNIISPGKGNDQLLIEAGGNTVRIHEQDGVDTVVLSAPALEVQTALTVAFDQGKDLSTLRIGLARGPNGKQVELYLNSTGEDRVTLDLSGANVEQFLNRLVVTAGEQTTTYAALLEAGQVFDGNDRDNDLIAFNRPSVLAGYGGNDTLIGSDFNDVLDGGSGNDYIEGGLGDDAYKWGLGSGNDVLVETGGFDSLNFTNLVESDVLVRRTYSGSLLFTALNSGETLEIPYGFPTEFPETAIERVVFADGASWDANTIQQQSLLGTESSDSLYGSNGNDVLRGGAGDDYLEGGGGNDLLEGGDGNDSIRGGDGNDRLIGGAGNDFLSGEGGDDTFVWGRGDGNDVLYDFGAGDNDTLELAGLNPQDLTVVKYSNNDAVLTINATGEIFTITQNFDNNYRVENFLFADGTVWNSEAQQLNVPLVETRYGDWYVDPNLVGSELGDYIVGSSIENNLYGRDGNDVLDGGGGSDYLYGGLGDDVYIWGGGKGNDIISDYDSYYGWSGGGFDTLKLLDINATDILVTEDAGTFDLYVSNKATGELLTVRAGLDQGSNDYILERILFQDGSAWNAADIRAHAENVAPVLSGGQATLSLGSEDNVYFISENDLLIGFSDANGSNLSVTNLRASNGSFSNYNSATRTWSFTPVADYSGAVNLSYDVTDGLATVAATQSFNLIAVNDAPTGTVSINGEAKVGQVLIATNTLVDADGMGLLSYQWQVSSGDGTWSSLAGVTTDSLTLTDAQIGMQIRVNIAYTDGNGTVESVSSFATPSVATSVNRLVGTSDADVFRGTTAADQFEGLAGNDIYVIDEAGDVVVELTGDGVDTVNASISYTLGSNVENLTLTGISALSGTGNELDNTLQGNDGASTLAGGLGNDTYVIYNAGTTVVENANEGIDMVETHVDYTLGANIENARVGGYGWTDVTGNELDNVITGNTGNNVLNGGAGADTLAGGEGNDAYVVDNVGDVVIENVNEGIDTVKSSLSYTLGANVENLTLTGSDALSGTGNELDNTLQGNDGASTLVGGLGNDIYVIHNANSTVVENANEGIDMIETHVDYTLGANIENARVGGWGWTDVTGNELDNVITGNTGNNVLNGGAGADTLPGGDGNDTYLVDNAGDVVIENGNEGVDTIQSSVSYTLSANVENLILTGIDNINGAGNELDNLLDGNGGINVLTGGQGNDTYIVRNAGDVVVENANEGIDTVETHVDYTLGVNIENARVGGWGWTDVTGNELDNVITGNTGNNVLNGGAGADTLAGGDGNDTYVVDNAGDVVIENANEGIDTVKSSISYTLGAYVENLTLIGSTALSGTGNSLDNVIEGNDGASTLAGGQGNDTYVIYNTGTNIVENANEGIDTVETHVDYALGANIENARVGGWGWTDLTGNALDTVLTGNEGGNILDGGAGNDTLIGGAGNDKYQFGLGYGQDTVVENDAMAGNYDKVRFGAGVTEDQLWFRHVGNDLEVSIIGTEDKMTIQEWYSGSANHVEEFLLSDWRLLTDTNVENLVQAMASFSPPAAGQTTLPQDYQNSLSPTIAANWQW